jgi:hypothetical protein
MKRLLSAAVIVMYVAISAQAQTQAEKDRALKYLETTKQGVLDATAGLSEAQWKFKSAPDRWSVAEVTEHIAAAEDLLRNMVVNTVMQAPARPDGDDVKAQDDQILAMIPDRSHKAQAPEPLKPTNRFGSPQDSLKHFLAASQETEDLLKKHDDLRGHATDGPFGKKQDGYQWILFLAAHSERHTKQILEVKADPNFPKE